ncbi:hypothetical protein [Ktedonospora formicarum]|uniref:Uncharacterized protein n=1 Tax=Ktedonospora formicarum TaxID=2778364 RepID=A0A8J3I471_9CHLR|nr:hypothetical protein [Ktedonospora formicarum]GHO49049.1 hypothetical protein KSX_72120 [Ktedonospora formicarum]
MRCGEGSIGAHLLDLDLSDAGFDALVLSEFRTRFIDKQAEHRLLESMLTLFQQKGWLKARGRQRTDSTHMLAKVCPQSSALCLGNDAYGPRIA